MKNKLLQFIFLMGVITPVVNAQSALDKPDIKTLRGAVPLTPLRCTLAATSSQTNISCNGSNNGAASITITAGAGSYTYSWAPGGDNTATLTGLSAGSYTCTITDANTCSITKIVNITQPNVLTAANIQTNLTCNGDSSGTAGVTINGGIAPYTYTWTPKGGTAATATGLAAGSYTCTISDANNCTLTKTFSITQPAAVTATTSQVNVRCNGGSNGVASVTVTAGVSPYTYVWSPGGGNAAVTTDLPAGSYTCTVTDMNTCMVKKLVTITAPLALTASTIQQNITCNGLNNGIGTVTPAGGTGTFSYSWVPVGGNAATATNLPAGNYTCVITDTNSCTLTKTFTINEPLAISATSSQTNVICNGGNNGTAGVIATGGTPGYTYLWTPNASTSATATSLAAGSYTCTITDANACTLAKTVAITEPTAITTTVIQVNLLCNGDSTGAASITASGGVPDYTYLWSPSGGTASTASGLRAGNYACTITDAKSCTAIRLFTLTQPAAIAVPVVSTMQPGCGKSNGSLTVQAYGGISPYNYNWNTGITEAMLSNISAGTYTCTVKDSNGCTAVVQKMITNPAPPIVTFDYTGADSLCSKASPVTLNGGSPVGGTYSANGIDGATFNPVTVPVGWNVITYSYVNTDNCAAAAQDSIYVKVCNSSNVITPSSAEAINLYPNPASNTLIVTYESTVNKLIAVKIMNVNGALMGNEKAENFTGRYSKQVNITAYVKGIYFVQFITENNVITKRLVVK